MEYMQMKLNQAAERIVKEIEKAGFEVYIVGGAVRDVMLKHKSTDWDITTNAKPEEVLPLFKESFYDNAYGTVMVAGKHLKAQFKLDEKVCEDEMIYDITTYRSEHGYSDKRRPDKVEWGETVEEDLKRRDFTINAMAIKIVKTGQRGSEVEIIDPYEGQKDLRKKIIKAVGEPETRFEEDALRMMRAIRIGAELGFEIESRTLTAITNKAANLAEISGERIGTETRKILATEHAAEAILLMANTGVLAIVIPELLPARGVKQAGHHIYDVFTHSLEALKACPSPDPVVRLATLLHDVDKPTVIASRGGKAITFYNHEVVGARTAKKIAERLRFSKKDQDRVFTLVRWHMFAYDSKMTDGAIRRFIRRVGKENIHDMMALRVGDRVGGGSKATSWRLTELQKRIGEQFYEPLSLKDLAIGGNEVMKILKLKPSKKVGELLNTLFEEIIEDSTKNTKEYLKKRVKELN